MSAYLLAWLEPGHEARFGIFSEPTPTKLETGVWAVIYAAPPSLPYEEAKRDVEETARRLWPWVADRIERRIDPKQFMHGGDEHLRSLKLRRVKR